MTITAKIIADSISEEGIRITSMQLRYPRFIHAELMTHRVFSRNASSSRAIPVERLIEDIINDTAMPIHWGKNQKGMQANEECFEPIILFDENKYNPSGKDAWNIARDHAIRIAQGFVKAGYHKQIVNRLLEPFSHINVLVTSTEWNNFCELRRHKDAQPEIHELADRMWEAMEASKPTLLKAGDWHLPYITDEEKHEAFGRSYFDYGAAEKLRQCSVARCARVSYLTFEGKPPNIENDMKLFAQLVGARPLHASPAEHQATPDRKMRYSASDEEGWQNTGIKWFEPHLHGNFTGWIQNRKLLELSVFS